MSHLPQYALSLLYFGKDDAETDISTGGLLRQGFLETAAYEAALSGRKHLIIGRKGSGKSAICMTLAAGRAGDAFAEVSLVTPDEISAEEIRRFELDGITPEQSKALLWRYVFAVQIAKCVVAHADSPQHQGRPPDSVGALRRFLLANGEVDDPRLHERFWKAIQRIKSSLSLEAFGFKVGVSIEAPSEGIRASSELEVIERQLAVAFHELGCPTSHGHLLLVDQVEKVWSNDRDSDLMVTGLLLAAKHVSAAFDRVRCVVFLRTDIYELLQFQDRDKFRGDEIRIDWSAERLLDLIQVRAQASLGIPIDAGDLWARLFPARVDGRPTPASIVDFTLMRPRDVIQLCNACRDTAEKNGHHYIEGADLKEAVDQYSNWKLQDLINEYRVNYPFLSDLFVLFQNSSYLVTREELERRVGTLAAALSARYREHAQVFNVDGILDILYGIGFLGVLRGAHPGFVYQEPRGVEPQERRFVIHPCFRAALRSTSSVDVQPFAPVVARSRFMREASPNIAIPSKTRGHRSIRTLAYLDRACERVRAVLVEASLPTETRREVAENLRAIQANAEELRYDVDPFGEVTVDQVELSHRAMRFFEELRAKLGPSGLVAGEGSVRLDRALERAAKEIRSGLVSSELS